MLSIVPTPVGNLEDITQRAIRLLKECDSILAEDTRTTKFLLDHLGIVGKKMQSFHSMNEHQVLDGIVHRLQNGEHIVLVSDAGTPGISDPGFLLSRACVEQDIPLECLPGATAFVPALVVSGLPCERFVFEGFLPPKKGRQTRLAELKEEKLTMVFYESPHRILRTLEDFCNTFGEERQACIVRELSKKFEEQIRGSLQEILLTFKEKEPRGEFVIVVKGSEIKSHGKKKKESSGWNQEE